MLATGDTIIWSARQDDIHQQRVALIVDKEASRALLEWTPINERLLYIRLNSRFVKLSIVVSYAPIEGAEEETKDDFYDILQAGCGKNTKTRRSTAVKVIPWKKKL